MVRFGQYNLFEYFNKSGFSFRGPLYAMIFHGVLRCTFLGRALPWWPRKKVGCCHGVRNEKNQRKSKEEIYNTNLFIDRNILIKKVSNYDAVTSLGERPLRIQQCLCFWSSLACLSFFRAPFGLQDLKTHALTFWVKTFRFEILLLYGFNLSNTSSFPAGPRATKIKDANDNKWASSKVTQEWARGRRIKREKMCLINAEFEDGDIKLRNGITTFYGFLHLFYPLPPLFSSLVWVAWLYQQLPTRLLIGQKVLILSIWTRVD